MSKSAEPRKEFWPSLPFNDWRKTAATLHMRTQIVGKIRMVQSPWLDHFWHVTPYVTPRGMTTGNVPHGERIFSIDFDFIGQQLSVTSCDGAVALLPLDRQDTADPEDVLLQFLQSASTRQRDSAGGTSTRISGGVFRRGVKKAVFNEPLSPAPTFVPLTNEKCRCPAASDSCSAAGASVTRFRHNRSIGFGV